MTVNDLTAVLLRHPGDMEVRVDPDIDLTDQTEQEVTAEGRLIDEDGREFLCLHMRNT